MTTALTSNGLVVASTAWVNMTMQNGWVTLSPYAPPSVRRSGDGVRMRGVATAGSRLSGVLFATLSSTFWPTHKILGPLASGNNTSVPQFTLDTNGELRLFYATPEVGFDLLMYPLS